MTYSKINIISSIQHWMDSEQGQTFLNYAYAWGASIVILGTLFKLTHLPWADFFLFMGMGTEVIVFFISAFDRPFDKVADSPAAVQSSLSAPMEKCDVEKKIEELIGEVRNITAQLPQGLDAPKMRDTLTDIHKVYVQQLLKLTSQLSSIDDMDRQMKIQAVYMKELNTIYAKMLSAVNVTTLPEDDNV